MKVISASILSADLCNLAGQLPSLEKEAGWLHLDVMDGLFVPNISFGFPFIKSLRPKTKMLFDTHLMVAKPERFLPNSAEAGSDSITFHLEASKSPLQAIKQIHSLGKKAGIALNLETPAEKAFPFLHEADLALVMGVKAGFGGQALDQKAIEKVRIFRQKIDSQCLPTVISLDGGVNMQTGKSVLEAGANVLVMGSAVFKFGTPTDTLVGLKKEFGL